MLIETKEIEDLAEKLNLSKEEILRGSLKVFLEKKLREINTEIFKISIKYGVSSVEEFEDLYKKGKIEEKDSLEDFQQLDRLEYKKDELEKTLGDL